MRKLFFTSFLLIVFFVTTGLGCKGLSKEQQVAVRPITLTYWTVFNDVTQLRKLAEEYKATRPHVTVNIKQVRPEEFDTLFANALADDVGPDIVSIHNSDIQRYTTRLSPMPSTVTVSNFQQQGTVSKELVVVTRTKNMPTVRNIESAYVQTVAKDVVVDGQIYGLPLSLDTIALYYNKDLLDKAGVPLPPTTWSEFLEAVTKSTRIAEDGTTILQSGVAMGTSNNIDHSAHLLALLMMQNRIKVVDNGRAVFSSGLERANEAHPALQALRFYTDFAREEKEVYSWNTEQLNALDEFTRGKSVFYFGFAFDYPRIVARAPQMNLEVIPIPQLNNEVVNVADYWVESVVKKSTKQNDAWDFIQFMSLPVNVEKYTTAARRPTPLRSQVAAQMQDEVLSPFASQVLTAENWYRGQNSPAAIKALKDLITNYMFPYGEENPLRRDANLIINTASVVQQTL